MSADYSAAGGSFTAGKPQDWSPTPVRQNGGCDFDLTPDGKRLLALSMPAETLEHAVPRVTVLLNFFDELRRMVPLNGK